MRPMLPLLVLVLLPSIARAQMYDPAKTPKPIRERFKQIGVEEKAAQAAEKVKKACGCTVEFKIDGASFGDPGVGDSWLMTKSFALFFASYAADYCNDEQSKKELCTKVKSVTCAYGKDLPVEWDSKTATIHIYAHSGVEMSWGRGAMTADQYLTWLFSGKK